ncbi:hypothetical protein [Thermoanaerobacter sp. A7A]|uniref:hypothetical protein n=1 Tax=Thermoanaerobacter sp. A7A TaxID=1350366 RepID=UPI000425D863|nr:hypothetical protein [Thermoanaerobacter sp. A7A]
MENKMPILREASIIEEVDLKHVENTMRKISQFQAVVQNTLKKKKDYGVIPGTDKPTLLKPGAEKILMMMGLRSEFEIIDSTRDWEKRFFQYQVKCKLYKGDMLITEGFGACNTKEKKYAKSDPYTLDNTVLKMAKKRALIDATLLVASLSDIFTQDVEDLEDIEGTPVQDKISKNQLNLIQKLIKEKEVSEEDYKKALQKYYNTTEGELTKEQASDLIRRLMNMDKKQKKNNVQKNDEDKETKQEPIDVDFQEIEEDIPLPWENGAEG